MHHVSTQEQKLCGLNVGCGCATPSFLSILPSMADGPSLSTAGAERGGCWHMEDGIVGKDRDPDGDVARQAVTGEMWPLYGTGDECLPAVDIV